MPSFPTAFRRLLRCVWFVVGPGLAYVGLPICLRLILDRISLVIGGNEAFDAVLLCRVAVFVAIVALLLLGRRAGFYSPGKEGFLLVPLLLVLLYIVLPCSFGWTGSATESDLRRQAARRAELDAARLRDTARLRDDATTAPHTPAASHAPAAPAP